jgi:hypothetical protein
MVTVAIVIAIITGVAKAVKDTITHRYWDSIFKDLNAFYWNPVSSSGNKYKYGILRRTIFVWTTDAWHLMDTIETMGLLAIGATSMLVPGGVFWIIATLGSAWAVKGLVFELCYSKLFR